MQYNFNKIFVWILLAFFMQLYSTSYSNDVEKNILNNIAVNEYDNNHIGIIINTDNPLKKYETKQYNDITTIILPLTTISSNFQIKKCACNNLVKNIDIQYLPYLNKNTNLYGYTKLRLWTNPDIKIMVKFDPELSKTFQNNNYEITTVKNNVTNLKKSSKKFKSLDIMPIIKNIRSKNEKTELNIKDRRYKYDLNLDEEKLTKYKNAPIKFPFTKEIIFLISKNIFVIFIGFILALLFIVLGLKKKDWKVK